MMERAFKKDFLADVLKHGLFPAAFYLLTFCLLTYPLIFVFSTRFFTDAGDGMQNGWNIWWINRAISQPGVHPSIWHTDLLHWPFGVTLLGQTLNPFNGLSAVPLLRFMTLVQAFNTMTLFSFVMGGVTAYWLSFYLTRHIWGSLTAGFIFTFSSYHFAHYYGHMQLISLEWIPLFVLCWIILIEKPGIWIGIASALTLGLVLLCDYYYFFYCVLTGGLIVLWAMVQKRDVWFLLRKDYLAPIAVFLLISLLLAGPVVFPFMRLARIDPFLDAHKPENFSLDLLALFVPGEGWRFGQLTEAYWSKLPIGLSEASVYLGYAVIILLVYLWKKRRSVEFASPSQIHMWFFLLGFFFLMALGPTLQIFGRVVYRFLMPYSLLEFLLPFLKLSGVPVRMVVMVSLAAAVLSAMALRVLFQGSTPKKYLFLLLLALLVFEYLPGTLPSTSTEIPDYVNALAEMPNDGGLLDLAAPTRYLQLYYQTAHGKPLVYGYVSRLPTSVAEKEAGLTRAINRGEYVRLWDVYHIRYIATKELIEEDDPFLSIELVYRSDGVNVYRLDCEC
ncbi:MAG: YfhO family protein [Anaerolineae bacterium]|nr:YfhO family protein [Anaerolineae bacterium]